MLHYSDIFVDFLYVKSTSLVLQLIKTVFDE